MRRLVPLLLLLCACDEQVIPPFGDLHNPVAVAVHVPTRRVLVASEDRDELRVFDLGDEAFLPAPAVSFPLSVPTVPTPRLLGAGQRFVFVVSAADGSVAFVDTEVPPGAFGPRSVDDAEGRPITVATGLAPTAAVAFTSLHPYGPGELRDHFLVAGLLPDGSGGRIVAVRPPFDGAEPEILSSLDLPGILPAGIAIEDGYFAGDVPDCRAVAIADVRQSPAHRPGVWLGRVRVRTDGSLALEGPLERIEVEVEVVLPDGSTERRVAPVRAVAFAPVHFDQKLRAAVADAPCALRTGRLFAVLDRSYCEGTASCPNFAAIDLPSGALARDETTGGEAAYELPAAPIGVLALDGPITVRGARIDRVDPESDPPQLRPMEPGPLRSLVLVSSSDGGITYVAGGLGTRLVGPGPGARTGSDAVFLLDDDRAVPGLAREVLRLDRRGTSLPRILFPLDARPRTETWTAGFEIPLPGLANLGGLPSLQGDVFRLPSGSRRNFLSPIPVRASADPEEADRLVPVGVLGVECDGFPVVAVEEEGRALRIERPSDFSNPPECLERAPGFSVLPPRGRPWTLEGSATGFVGRLPADETSAVRVGSRLLFLFAPPQEAVERGATFEWRTTSGFTFFRQVRSRLQLPAAMAALPVRPPKRWMVVVAYSGSDAIAVIDPTSPSDDGVESFR